MEFLITLESAPGVKPCAEAYEKEYTRTQAASDLFPDKSQWLRSGFNHRTEGNIMLRDYDKSTGWFIRFADLDELMAFVKKHGKVSIDTWPTSNPALPTIEIQDDIYSDE